MCMYACIHHGLPEGPELAPGHATGHRNSVEGARVTQAGPAGPSENLAETSETAQEEQSLAREGKHTCPHRPHSYREEKQTQSPLGALRPSPTCSWGSGGASEVFPSKVLGRGEGEEKADGRLVPAVSS